MLIFRQRRRAIVRIPSIALLVAAIWGTVELSRLTGKRHGTELTVGFAYAVAALLAVGTRIVRRAGDEIVMRTLTSRQSVSAQHAVLGVRMSGGARYWQLALELMAYPDFAKSVAVPVESFQPDGMTAVMGAARRASSFLGLPEPILAPGLIDDASRDPAHPKGDRLPWRPDLAGRWAAVSSRWTAASNLSKLLILIGAVSIVWSTSRSVLQPGGQLDLRCASSWHVRNDPTSFNFTCPEDAKLVDVPAGPSVLGVWDPARGCWIARHFVVPKNGRAVVHVDETVKAGRCADVSWPPP